MISMNKSSNLVPIIISPDNILPVDYPTPCNCLKCSRENVCACRSLSIPCCNPHNIEEMLNNLLEEGGAML